MFERGWGQAAGLRQASQAGGPALMPVACTAQPGRAYELLCALATQLDALGLQPVILDASASEVETRRDNDGAHLGLLHVLQSPGMAGLGHPGEGGDWLAMPSARGVQALQLTARAGGAPLALSRLLAPFVPEALVLLYAPAMQLGSLLSGLQADVLVPVLPHAQGSFDAYGAVKLLHGAGLTPVLAPSDLEQRSGRLPLEQVVQTVSDCAARHLDHELDIWDEAHWGHRVQASALRVPADRLPGQDQPRLLLAEKADLMAVTGGWS